MANKKEVKSNNSKKVAICVSILAIVVVIVAAIIVLVVKNKPLDDTYFVSDDTKYVLTLDSSDISMEDPTYNPVKSHLVYTYSGNDITGLKAYYEYADNNAAKTAAEYLKQNYEGNDQQKIAVDGKYVIFTATEAEYEGLTASDIKQQIEFMELLKNMSLDDNTESNE